MPYRARNTTDPQQLLLYLCPNTLGPFESLQNPGEVKTHHLGYTNLGLSALRATCLSPLTSLIKASKVLTSLWQTSKHLHEGSQPITCATHQDQAKQHAAALWGAQNTTATAP